MKKEDLQFMKQMRSVGSISREQAKKLWCGELIGKGMNRNVYVCKLNANYVVKLQMTNTFENALEWNIWNDLRSACWWEKWFAPCVNITETGMVLIQKRATFPDKKLYPKRIPYFFTDMKYQNYGFIDDQFVCVDYSGVLTMLISRMGKQMRNAKWWDAVRNDKKIKKLRTKDYKIVTRHI